MTTRPPAPPHETATGNNDGHGATQPAHEEPYWAAWTMTEEEDMGQSMEQFECISMLLGALKSWVEHKGWQRSMYVGADQFFKWIEGQEERVMVSPDLYILEPHPPSPRPASIRTWLPEHHPPRLAVEIVSTDWRKDYDINPPRYEDLGVEELVIFDPHAARASPPSSDNEQEPLRVALSVYTRDQAGRLQLVGRGDSPIHSEVLDVWWMPVSTEQGPRLRLAHAPAPDALVPLPEDILAEARATLEQVIKERDALERLLDTEQQARADAEQARVEAEQARADAEQKQTLERLAREQAEQTIQQLKAELARLKQGE